MPRRQTQCFLVLLLSDYSAYIIGLWWFQPFIERARESPQLSGASSFLVIYFHMESLVSLGFIQYPIFFSNKDFATHCRLGLKSCGCVSKWEEIDSGMLDF